MSVSWFTPERSSDFTETQFDDSVVDCMLGVLGDRILTCAGLLIGRYTTEEQLLLFSIKSKMFAINSKFQPSPNSLHKSKSNSGGAITSQVSRL